MKPTLFRILAASMSLALAVGISSIYSGIREYRLKSTAMLTTSAALNARAPTTHLRPAESAEDNCVFLADDSKYRGYLNGEILPLSMNGYRENWTDLDLETAKEVRTWKDEISAWHGTKRLWSRPFPPDAELVFDTRRIFAMTKTKSAIYFKEITVPKNRDR